MATTSTADSYDDTVTEIEETLGIVPGFFGDMHRDDLVNEWPTFKRMALGETTIPAKYKELINLAVAANLKCPYCIHFHREAAKLHGATDEELTELSFLAGYTPRYSSMLHAQEYDLDQFEEEVEQIGAHLQSQMAADD
ncbi:carboxymuconolactone decarboxylase family protein [Halobaculum magnesiiphilum]|uniref:Carboxymuconolactone decarboxylase family protein n=1 Tax=Halobaculum magnesiiphilum TaxID=1017351 RepID=A0A8T8WFD7_9EURY|nr:carboxymuconolactone decarboxylase family protein [Halobaculum magnesiiphilum]QZP38496.1 carboxymuconolactone decarboxylase family protein [Halobaculum magnesiiphilum]